MSLVINTNVASLNSQRQLMNSGGALDKATERLSSGLRINSAKDDAAGLAISNRMTSQVRGLDQAIRNANDGVSLIQTAEGALQETTNILQRMRELSIQSGNGIYTDADRKTLDAEVQQLTAELNRIATSTSFNGQNLLDGTLGKVNLQVGADANQTITMKIPKMDAKTLGMGSTSGDVAGAHLSQSISKTKFNDGDILINGKSIGAFDGTKVPPDTFEKLLANINEKVEGISATAFNEVTTITVGTGVTTTSADLKITLTNPDNTVSQLTINNTNTVDELVTAINEKSGGLLVATKTENGLITLANANGATIEVSGTGDRDAILGKITTPSFGQIALTAKNGQDIVITQGPNAKQPTVVNGLAMPAGGITAGTLRVNGVNIAIADKPEFKGADFPLAALLVGDVGNVVIGSKTYPLTTGNSIATLVGLINADSAITGIRAENGGTGNGNLQLFNAAGTPMVISGTPATLTATGLVGGTYVDQAEVIGTALPSASVGTIGAGSFTLNGTSITLTSTDTISEVLTAINAQAATTGITAVNGGGVNGSIQLFDDMGAPVTIAGTGPLLASIGLTAGKFSTPSADLAATIAAVNAQTLNTGVVANNGGLSERGSLVLTDTRGRDVNVSGSATAVLTSLGLSEGSTVASNLLEALGFQETRQGATVFGQHIPATNSTKPLAFGDLSINGVTISGENTLTLQGKVNNINAKSDDTGVIASLKAENVSTVNVLKLTTEVTAGTYGSAVAGNLILNGVSVAIAAGDPLSTSIAKINAAFSSTGVLAYQDSNNKLHLYSEGQINIGQTATTAVSLGLTVALNAPSVGTTGSIRLNNTQINFSNIGDLTSVMSTINSQQANTGVYASLNELGQLVLNSNSAFSIDSGDVNGGKTLANFGLDATLAGPMGVLPAAAESLTTVDMANTSAELTGTDTTPVTAAGNQITLNGALITFSTGAAAQNIIEINAAATVPKVIAYADSTGALHLFSDDVITTAATGTNAAVTLTNLGLPAAGTTPLSAGTTGSISLNGTAISLTNIDDINTALNQINAQQGITGVYASLSDTGQLSLKSASAILIGPGDVNGGKALANLGFSIAATGPIVVPATVAPVPGAGLSTNVLASIELNSLQDTPISVAVSANGSRVTGLISQNQESSGSGFGSSIGSISIATQDGAQKAIKVIDIALDTINDVRSQLGAINNRLEFTVNNLANVSEKTSASRSRIVDADFAAETAAMSRAQVLQQAATAMLAQSNARPKEVLSLLR